MGAVLHTLNLRLGPAEPWAEDLNLALHVPIPLLESSQDMPNYAKIIFWYSLVTCLAHLRASHGLHVLTWHGTREHCNRTCRYLQYIAHKNGTCVSTTITINDHFRYLTGGTVPLHTINYILYFIHYMCYVLYYILIIIYLLMLYIIYHIVLYIIYCILYIIYIILYIILYIYYFIYYILYVFILYIIYYI